MDIKTLKELTILDLLKGKYTTKKDSVNNAISFSNYLKESKQKETNKKNIKFTSIVKEDNDFYEIVNNQKTKINDTLPFEIPEDWIWTRLGNIANLQLGKSPPSKEEQYWNGTHNWLSISDLNETNLNDSKKKISDYAINEIFKRPPSPKGTLIMSFKLTIGKVAIIENETYHNEAIVSIFNFSEYKDLIKYYLFNILPIMTKFATTKSAIKGNTLNSESLFNILIPIPPLEVFLELIEKLEELNDVFVDFTKVTNKIEEINKKLQNEFKKSIIQDAIQGKLVNQDKNDTPAKVLIDEIAKSKEQLIKDKVIKRDKFNSYIYKDNNRYYEQTNDSVVDITDDLPFKIPNSWEWVRLGNIIEIKSGLNYKKEFLNRTINHSIKILRGGNIEKGKIIFKPDDLKIDSSFIKESYLYLKKWMLLTPSVTSLELLGKTAFVEKDYLDAVYGGFVFGFITYLESYYLSKFLYFLTNSYFYKQQLNNVYNKSGSAFYNLPKTKMQNILIPLPPLNEQKRIVAKIEEIFKTLETTNK